MMETKSINTEQYPENDYRSYLQHHGVKGQKWGVRNYQNLDGSLTPLGREHYGYGKARGKGSSESDTSRTRKMTTAQKALEKGPDGFKDTKAYLEAITKDCFSMSDGRVDYANYRSEQKNGIFSGINKRANDAADLGLEALKAIDRKHGYTSDIDTDNERQGWREWFLWEDQTIGLPMVADLINKGYTAKQVNKLIDELEDNYDDRFVDTDKATSLSTAMFDVIEGNWGNSLKIFAEACDEVKNSGSVKAKGAIKDYASKQASNVSEGVSQTVRHPVNFVKSYAESVGAAFKEMPKALATPIDTTKYNRNVFSKLYQMNKQVRDVSITSSNNPLIKASSNIARTSAERLYNPNSFKLPLDPINKASVNLGSKLIYKKDYWNGLSENDKLSAKNEIAYQILLNNMFEIRRLN